MSKYWEERALQRELEADLIAEKYLAKMQERLKETQLEILREIEYFYERYSVRMELSMDDAKKLLTASDDAVFKAVTLERFRALSLEGRPEMENLLNAISSRVRISRLESLNMLIELKMLELYGGRNGLVEYAYTGLAEIYENSYYTSLYDFAKGGLLQDVTVEAIDDQTMSEILSYDWSGKEFSERIWGHQQEVRDAIREELEKGLSSGRSVSNTSKAIVERTDVAYSKAEALVRTESNFFHGLASQNSYEVAGIDEYEILATLDSRTSETCQKQDGKIYKTSQYKPGKTAPPFHVRCRTTTAAYFDEDEYTSEERRQSAGGLVQSMTFSEWKSKYVKAA